MSANPAHPPQGCKTLPRRYACGIHHCGADQRAHRDACQSTEEHEAQYIADLLKAWLKPAAA